MASRLLSVLTRRKFRCYDEYWRFLGGKSAGSLQEFISALTTNTTHFFRESGHFDVLRKAATEVARSRDLEREPLRIWCGASSTGQEPLSILMTLAELDPNLANRNVKFLATDVDLDALDKAARGRYALAELERVPPILQKKYFQSVDADGVELYQFDPVLLRKITYAQFNLMTKAMPFQHPFDFIFLRNVLIYFHPDIVRELLGRLGNSTRPGGMIFLGYSEAGYGREIGFESESQSVFTIRSKDSRFAA
jgi:chemotaxis protein methyltransferase CheR